MGTFTTPNGNSLTLFTRGNTNDDPLAHAILVGDEYRLHDLKLTGWALDIGAHIGTVGLALAVDNPQLQVICVEPVPDNAHLIRMSIAANGLDERVFVEEAGAGVGVASTRCQYAYTAANNPDKGYIEQSRFIGNVFRDHDEPEGTTIEVPTVTIAGLADKYGVPEFRFCKIDCEGCEWRFFAEGAERIAEIVGEWHDGPLSALEDLLGPTHTVTALTDLDGMGLFRAVRHD